MTNLQKAGLIGSGYDYRSAIWGFFVTKSYAEKHPATTVKEKKKVLLRIKKSPGK